MKKYTLVLCASLSCGIGQPLCGMQTFTDAHERVGEVVEKSKGLPEQIEGVKNSLKFVNEFLGGVKTGIKEALVPNADLSKDLKQLRLAYKCSHNEAAKLGLRAQLRELFRRSLLLEFDSKQADLVLGRLDEIKETELYALEKKCAILLYDFVKIGIDGQFAAEMVRSFKELVPAYSEQKVLELGGLTDHKDAFGKSPLHWAAESGNKEMVYPLLSLGCKIDQEDIFGKTPMHYAVMGLHVEVVELLLKHGARLNTLCKAGYAPLHELVLITAALPLDDKDKLDSCIKARLDFFEWLVHQGALIESEEYLFSPLHLAARGLCELSLAAQQCTLERDAIRLKKMKENSVKAHLMIIDTIMALGGRVLGKCKKGKMALHYAAQSGAVNIVRRLLTAHDADMNARTDEGLTAVQLATIHKKAAALNYLLKRHEELGVTPLNDKMGRSALHHAVISRQGEMMDVLFEHEFSVFERDREGYTPLHHAIIVGFIPGIERLRDSLKEEKDLLLECKYGLSVFEYALMLGRSQVVRQLCEIAKKNGWKLAADDHCRVNFENKRTHITILDNFVNCLLQYAAETESEVALASLRHYMDNHGIIGVDPSLLNATDTTSLVPHVIDSRDSQGLTAAEKAAKKRNLRLLEQLLDLGATLSYENWTACDSDGYSLGHALIKAGAVELMKKLSQKGVDFQVLDRQGRTLLNFAVDLKTSPKMIGFLASRTTVDVQDIHGVTALDRARNQKNEVTEMILASFKRPAQWKEQAIILGLCVLMLLQKIYDSCVC